MNKSFQLSRRIALLISVSLGALTFFSSAFAAPSEYDVKATYIARFTEFIDWPTVADNVPFDICVLGAHPIETPLSKLPAIMRVKNRALQVLRIDSIQAATSCAIVFVPSREASRMRALQQLLQGLPVLTVSDTPGFLAKGSLLNFYYEGDHLRFEIHLHAAEEAGLKFSSRLLKIATIGK